mgnify:CR=1 FL=1
MNSPSASPGGTSNLWNRWTAIAREASARIPERPRRWLKWIAIGLVGLYLAYIVLGAVFLNTPLGPWVANRKPEKFQIDWGSGVTWWPGRVTVWDVKMKGHVARTQWSVQAGKAQGRVAIGPMFSKVVRVPEVRAFEVTGDVDLVDKRLPPPAARPGGWALQFDRIVTDSIRRGRFAGITLEGTGSAEVGFYKQMRGGPLELMPSKAHFDGARLQLDGKEMMRDGNIDATFAIARHTRAQAPGAKKLLLTDATLALDGTTAALHITANPQGKITVATVPGTGTAHAKIGFARGALTPGSQLRWHMPLTGTDSTGTQRAESLDVNLDVDQDVAFKAHVPSQQGGVLALDADLHLRGTQVPVKDFGSLLPRTSGHVVGRWQFASLAWLTHLFTNAPWLKLEGSGAVDVDMRVADGKIAAGSRIGVPDVTATADVMGNRIQGRARAEGRLDAGQDNTLLPSLDLVMDQFNIAADDALTRPYVRGQDLHLNLQTLTGVDPAQVRAQLKTPGALRQARDALRARLVFKDAQVPDLRAYNRYLPREHIRFDGGSGRLSGDVTLDGTGDIGRGSLKINGNGAQLHLAGLALRGNVDANIPLQRASLQSRNFNIDGTTIALTGISFSEPGGESSSGWWARINLDRARMDWDRPMRVNGTARIAMRDVGFLLSLFSRKRDYPKWVYKLIDSGQAQVRGNIQWSNDTLVLDRMVAQNQRYEVKARLRLRGKSRVGSLYAHWGVLSCAVAVNNGKRDFHMIKAREWYDSQPDLLR